MESPGNRDPGPGLWLKQSRRHGLERRSAPGPSRLGATRSSSLSRWLVSQGSRETDFCGRKNKHQPCRIPSAARFPWLQRLRRAGPNPTRARILATSRRTGKPRNSCRARIAASSSRGASGRSIWSRSSLFELSIWAFGSWGLRAAVAVTFSVPVSKPLIKALSRSQCSQRRTPILSRELPRQLASADFAALVCRNYVDDKDSFRHLPSAQRGAAKS